MTGPEDPRVALLLAHADDELILGHRHAEWTGWAPHIEEDLAFSSIAQDEMAHARMLYGLAADLSGRDEDALALGRRPAEYRNAVLCERPNRDWGYTVARQYLYDTADEIRMEALSRSAWRELAEAVAVIRLEEKYHLDHARAWFERLSAGPVTARQRYAEGFAAAIAEAVGLFEPLPGEGELVAEGILPRTSEDMLAQWVAGLGEELEAAALDFVLHQPAPAGEMVPTSSGEIEEHDEPFTAPGLVKRDGRWVHEGAFAGGGGRAGRHSEDFLPLWDEMTRLHREHPGASW
ncbi:MAG: phenylacetate-CoA oxygenase subunit PaaC [Actinobacteria bacterium]|nr:phenylacetate-CoA oxygenase subunit PaaC [Actinomycetota bacterium]